MRIDEIMKQSSSAVLVGAGKSKRLDALRNKVSLNMDKAPFRVTQKSQEKIENELSQFANEALEQAKHAIEERISKILNAYPPGKSKTFFKLKYGVDVQMVKRLSLRKVFDILTLNDSEIKYFKKIQHLNIYGVIAVS